MENKWNVDVFGKKIDGLLYIIIIIIIIIIDVDVSYTS